MVSKNPVAITVTQPVVVTAAGQSGRPYSGLPVYAFDGESYTGFNGTTDAQGQVTFTLPQGSYRLARRGSPDPVEHLP